MAQKKLEFKEDGSVLLLARTYTPPPTPGASVPTPVRSGNPFRSSSGKFGFGPPGVSVIQGGPLLARALNSAKQAITNAAQKTGANQIAARPSTKPGQIEVTLYKNGKEIGHFMVGLQSEQPPMVAQLPENVDPEEWQRRQDAVREAAREFEHFDLGDAKDFLKGKTTRELTDHEVEQFVNDVHDQRLSELVDIIDQQMRQSNLSKFRSRRQVRVQAPRGHVKYSLNGLSDDEVQSLVNRVEARGHAREDVTKHIVKRFQGRRQELLSNKLGVK